MSKLKDFAIKYISNSTDISENKKQKILKFVNEYAEDYEIKAVIMTKDVPPLHNKTAIEEKFVMEGWAELINGKSTLSENTSCGKTRKNKISISETYNKIVELRSK